MNIELLLPTAWSDVTLGEFIVLSKLDIDEHSNPIDYYVKILRVFGNDISEVANYIKVNDSKIIASSLSFMQIKPTPSNIKQVKIDGIEYFLPTNMNELTVGEVISIETLIEGLTSVEAMDAILSVILRPKDEVFDSNKVVDRRRLFKANLNIEDVLGMSVFF